MNFHVSLRALALAGLILVGCSAPPVAPRLLAQQAPTAVGNTKSSEGADLVFGGPGVGPGQFLELRDITFDAQGNLYALDGARPNPKTKAREGNLRVQKFDNNGKLLQIFDLRDQATGLSLGDKNDPQRVAADGNGNVYVTIPAADKVLVFGAAGQLTRALDVPNAMAIAAAGQGAAQRIVVAPGAKKIVDRKWSDVGGDKLLLLLPGASGIEKTIALPQQYTRIEDIAVGQAGDFYLKAAPNAIYQFSPDGRLVKTFGGNPTKRAEDGSEVVHTVAVDSGGNVYSMTWGNPGLVTRFDADGKTVTQRAGQFKWADPWSANSSYVPLAIDPTNDRLWAAATQRYDPSYVHFAHQRSVPAIIRTKADFFQNPATAVKQTPMRRVGFRPDLSSDALYNISYQSNAPVTMSFSVGAANRFVNAVTVNWHAFDARKTEIGKGTFGLPLKNGEDAKTTFTWTPPRYGAYFVWAEISSPQGSLGALGENIAVTPRYPNMVALSPGERTGNWSDSASQMWAGLPALRLHPGLSDAKTPAAKAKKLDALDAQIAAGEKVGATILVQLVDRQNKFNADDTRAIMERFKGRIKYIEVVNEPNFSGSAEDYFKIHQQAYQIIKAIDPGVVVMGPGTVNISLNWAKKLYELGFENVSDAISFHDYEGHESISPEHWQYKYDALHEIMAGYGDADKPVWQTERAIAGVRGNNYQGLVQAIRLGLHLDLLETLGIPNAHDFHYYLNQGGYSSVPSYVWSAQGPMPAAVLTRTRYALTSALRRHYAGTLDFGDGNDLFLGVRFAGADGETVSLRNLGTPLTPLDFGVKGATTLEVTDAWGNQSRVPVQNGRATLTLGQLPIYVRLPQGASLTAPKMNLGRDLAPRAQFRYSGATKSDYGLLNNGVIETYHAGNPNGDTNGAKIWTGELPRQNGKVIPQTLEISFAQPQRVGAVLLRGVRGDNAFSALLAYDLQYDDGGTWKTIAAVDNSMPQSEEATTADADHVIWMDDTNFYLNRFAPVTTARLRLVVKDASRGFVPDERARAWGKILEPKLMLREIEIF